MKSLRELRDELRNVVRQMKNLEAIRRDILLEMDDRGDDPHGEEKWHTEKRVIALDPFNEEYW